MPLNHQLNFTLSLQDYQLSAIDRDSPLIDKLRKSVTKLRRAEEQINRLRGPISEIVWRIKVEEGISIKWLTDCIEALCVEALSGQRSASALRLGISASIDARTRTPARLMSKSELASPRESVQRSEAMGERGALGPAEIGEFGSTEASARAAEALAEYWRRLAVRIRGSSDSVDRRSLDPIGTMRDFKEQWLDGPADLLLRELQRRMTLLSGIRIEEVQDMRQFAELLNVNLERLGSALVEKGNPTRFKLKVHRQGSFCFQPPSGDARFGSRNIPDATRFGLEEGVDLSRKPG
ncbi:MAG: hypothetical protein QM770_01150 [Tepidisphaeraceae bacterium]